MNRRILAVAAVAWALATPSWAQESVERSHNSTPREQWQKVDEIFAAMQVKPGAAVADIGAGSGFFTTRLAASA